MGPRLLVEVKDLDTVSFVKLSGVIDEDNDLAEITGQINKPAVLVDTADIDRINSCGVRDWVTWLGEVDKKGTKVYLLECSPAIMTQVNLVNNFSGPGAIVNFYSPYFCPSCETDKMLLVDVAEAKKALPFKAPVSRCDDCDHTMEFDDIEGSYFGFLSTTKVLPKNADVDRAIQQISAGRAGGTLRTRRTTVAPYSATKGAESTAQATSPTTPSTRDLKGLLTPAPDLGQKQAAQLEAIGAPVQTFLYLIIVALVLTVGILAYIVLTRMG